MHTAINKPGPPGLWIAVFGPDGAGKSAVIDQLTHQLDSSFSGIVGFHFRPQFRRHAVERPAVTKPHAKRPRCTLLSLAKLIYWLLDCWFGYLVTVRRAVAGSQLVIFDRYLPDILIDPLRYRLPAGSLPLARMLLPMAPCPDLCILLDVPAEVVQGRKQEVSPDESQRQRSAYLAMFEALPNTLLVDADCPVEQVTSQVINGLFSFMITTSSRLHEEWLSANL